MLEVKNINCQKGFNLLFANLSFYLKAGTIARIQGSNGSGKTSLLRILAGISQTEGVILLDEDKIKSDKYQQQVLYLGHQSLLSPYLSVFENLEFLLKLSGNFTGDILTALNKIGLGGYENEPCYQLSAGQKRKVILASIFLSTAKLWLLDEPFTALDANSVELIEERILEHTKNGGICILTTHQESKLNMDNLNLN